MVEATLGAVQESSPIDEKGDHGRSAGTPSQIPARGWRDISWRVLQAMFEDRVFALAGGVAYYGLIAVFPAIAMVVSVYGIFADSLTIAGHLSLLAQVLPPGSAELLATQINRVASEGSDALGIAFLTSLVVSLWSANAGMSAMFDAINVVYKEKEKRSLWRYYATTLLFTVLAVAFLIVAITGIVILPVVLELFGWGGYSDMLISVARWPGLFIMMSLSLALIYRYGASRRPAKWRWITWGSFVAAGLWIAVSMAFSWYVTNFDSYNRMYGSLGAVVAFMIWLWLSSVVVLFGAELNAETEHQTARDSTEGIPKPLGERGAVMADTIGEAKK